MESASRRADLQDIAAAASPGVLPSACGKASDSCDPRVRRFDSGRHLFLLIPILWTSSSRPRTLAFGMVTVWEMFHS